MLAENLHYSQSIICDWEKGVKEPNANAIKTIAKFFNVTADYLLGIENDYDVEDNATPMQQHFTPEEQQLIEVYRTLSPGKKKALFDMLEISTEIQSKKKA